MGASKIAESLFDNFSHVIAQSEIDADRYRQLGARPVAVAGNLKVDTKDLPYDHDELKTIACVPLPGVRSGWLQAPIGAKRPSFSMSTSKLKTRLSRSVDHTGSPPPESAAMKSRKWQSSWAWIALDAAERRQSVSVRDVYLGDTIGEMGLYLAPCADCVHGAQSGSWGRSKSTGTGHHRNGHFGRKTRQQFQGLLSQPC